MRTIVTGAASGIGRQVALKLASNPALAPAKLLLADRDAERLEAVAKEVRDLGAQATTFVGDIMDPKIPAQMVEAADKALGGLDGIASNAGALRGALLKDLTLEDYEHQFAINTRPTWLLGKAAYPLLAASKGAIVATASMAATFASPPLGSYSASKAALAMLVEQMAIEWGPVGIRANCVSPGPTLTEMTAGGYADEKRKAQRESMIPLRRLGAPQDIANAIVFLLGPDASFISGVNLMVDGAMTRNLMPATGAGSGQT